PVGAGFIPVWLATAALVAVAAIIAPATLSSESFSAVLPTMTFLAVTALGQMLVVMTGGIDLSIPGVIVLVSNVIVGVADGQDGRLAIAIVICLVLSAAVGFINGLFVSIARLNPLIVTLAVGLVVLGIATRYASEIASESAVPPALSSWATDRYLGVSSLFWVGVGLTLAVAIFLRGTGTGRRFQAVGANSRAAWVAGLGVRRYVTSAYAVAGVLYGAAGILLAGFIRNPSLDLGDLYLLGPLAAVVIGGASLAGGVASPMSTLVAAFALTLLTQMLRVLGLSTALQYVVFGAAIAAGMVISGDRIVSGVGRLALRERRVGNGKEENTKEEERRW
ncbi:MAG: ABC transporter permease, partial [Chloroflexi bacterium]|nr:ABC transporter permease [Chloroflexota bacterium]